MELVFRNINSSELEIAYDIIKERTEWLLSKNIRQWITALPKDVIIKRQSNNENYGLFVNDQMAVFLSLVNEVNENWINETGNEKNTWLCTLCSSREYAGNNYGKTAIENAIIMSCPEIG